MGNLYLATQISLGRKVVIKELALNLKKDPSLVKRFENEAKSAAALDHENIIQVFDFGADNGSFFISMEYLDGCNLEQLMALRPFPREIGIIVLLKALKGLNYAHRRGVVHCDVKPANILVSRTGKVKVVDFGLAHATSQAADGGDPSTIFITPGYMPPEVARGSTMQDIARDVWSAGVLAYKIVSGRLPFTGPDVRATVHAIVNTPEIDIQELCPWLPGDCAAAVRACLQKDPKKRPAAIDGMIDSFNEYLYELGVRDSDKVLVEYLQDRKKASVELARLLAQYHRNKGNEYLDLGDIARSETHFKEAERFGPAAPLKEEPTRPLPPEYRAGRQARPAPAAIMNGILAWVSGLAELPLQTILKIAAIGVAVTAGSIALALFIRKTNAEIISDVKTVGGVFGPHPVQQAPVRKPAIRDTAPQPASAAMFDKEDTASERVAPFTHGREKTSPAPVAGKGAVRAAAMRDQGRLGTVKITLDPPTAAVYLDGKRILPNDIAAGVKVAAGSHALAAAASGYRSFTAILSVKANLVQSMPVALKPMERGAGFLHVYSYPWAGIYIDSTYEGTSPTQTPLTLPEGIHSVMIKRDGYKPYYGIVAVVQGEVARVKVRLEEVGAAAPALEGSSE